MAVTSNEIIEQFNKINQNYLFNEPEKPMTATAARLRQAQAASAFREEAEAYTNFMYGITRGLFSLVSCEFELNQLHPWLRVRFMSARGYKGLPCRDWPRWKRREWARGLIVES